MAIAGAAQAVESRPPLAQVPLTNKLGAPAVVDELALR